jgi:hypothetical protein
MSDEKEKTKVTIQHQKSPFYAIHPLTGFLVTRGNSQQPWILHAYKGDV